MIKITEAEEFELRQAYTTANIENTVDSIEAIRILYRHLGKKYGFNPRKVTINTKGEVRPITKETIYVVYYDENGGDVVMATRDKVKALEEELAHDGYQMKEVPLE